MKVSVRFTHSRLLTPLDVRLNLKTENDRVEKRLVESTKWIVDLTKRLTAHKHLAGVTVDTSRC